MNESPPHIPPDVSPFAYIHENEYVGGMKAAGNKRHQDWIGEEAMACNCSPASPCTQDSQCINRLLLMECGPDCPTGTLCENQRFQRREYAKVAIEAAPGKGHGLFTQQDVQPGQFIIEYVGQILDRETFQKRAQRYDQEGIAHFYFMTLSGDQIIDACKKGNVARFMNHSCQPNCATQKWITGGMMRIGLFSLKTISKGTELTFDYKFERFGTKAQPCLCGEANCKGFIGGQLEEMVEAAETEIDKPGLHLKRTNTAAGPVLGLEQAEDVTRLVKDILRTEQKDQLLRDLRILKATTLPTCLKKFLSLHGLKIVHALLTEYRKDPSIIYHVLSILLQLPVVTKNSIDEAKLEPKLQKLAEHEDATISELAKKILNGWTLLETVYRIPEKPKDEPIVDRNPSSSSVSTDLFAALKSSQRAFMQQQSQPQPAKASGRGKSSSGRATDREQMENEKSPHQSKPSDEEQSHHDDEERHRDPIGRLLPVHWRSATDEQGNVYYFHAVTRLTQWEFPQEEEAEERPGRQEQPRDAPSKKPAAHAFSDQQNITPAAIQEAIQKAKEHAAQVKTMQEKQLQKEQTSKEQLTKLREQISAIVIKTLSSYKAQMTPDEFRHLARKLTHNIIEKEMKRSDGSGTIVTDYVDPKTMVKMKEYLKEYLRKLGYKPDDRTK